MWSPDDDRDDVRMHTEVDAKYRLDGRVGQWPWAGLPSGIGGAWLGRSTDFPNA
jgi:hypothetical protein